MPSGNWRLLTAGAALVIATGMAVAREGSSQSEKIIVALPRAANAGEALTVELTVGALPDSTSVVVRTKDGTIAGTVSPYGRRARQAGGVYTIPIPSGAQSEGKVALTLELREKDGSVRAPQKKEIRIVKIKLVTVSR
jgi:hypothetical protein